MNTIKQIYQSPQVTEVRLDNEISLVLFSNPPDGPNEGGEGMNNQIPQYFRNDEPLKG
jgi:hypothetical protein